MNGLQQQPSGLWIDTERFNQMADRPYGDDA